VVPWSHIAVISKPFCSVRNKCYYAMRNFTTYEMNDTGSGPKMDRAGTANAERRYSLGMLVYDVNGMRGKAKAEI
jgi:hypothetical protein